MSIRCGKCKERHETSAEVRACYQIQTPSAPAQVAQERVAEPTPTEPGFYSSGPAVFRLDASGKWSKLMSNGRFAGPARAPYRPWKMTVEDVAAKGRIMVRCIVCGIKLTNPESRALGIGPICRGKV